MRLTVHVKNAQKQTAEVKTKDGTKNITKTMTTLSFENVSPENVPSILQRIESDKKGTPVKHYFSNDRAVGRSKGKKK